MSVVHLVTGPPCSGKSTHVDQHRRPGDALVCYDTTLDEVSAAMSTRSDWTRRQAALAIHQGRINDLASGAWRPPVVWVIATMAGRTRRQQLVEQLAQHHTVDHVHLVPTLVVLQQRARERPDIARALGGVASWFEHEDEW